jgi:hypothetical protein
MDSLFLKYFAAQASLPSIFRESVMEKVSQTRVEILAPGKALTVTPQPLV